MKECPRENSPGGNVLDEVILLYEHHSESGRLQRQRGLLTTGLLSIDASIKIKHHANDSLKEFARAAGRPLEGKRRKRIKCDRKSDDGTLAWPRCDGDSHGNWERRGNKATSGCCRCEWWRREISDHYPATHLLTIHFRRSRGRSLEPEKWGTFIRG